MRVALIMSHAERRLFGARRELHWLRGLAARGAEVRLFRMHPGTKVETEVCLDGSVIAEFHPSDDSTLTHRRRVSASLRAAVVAFRPTLLLFKALGYDVNADLVEALSPCPFGFIAGGTTSDRLLSSAALVLAEHEVQARHDFAQHHASGKTLLLPKFFDPELIGDGLPHPEPRYDIVNVGTFMDGRKNQTALLPLAGRWRTCFVGGGPRLDDVKSVASPGDRVFFVGHRRPEDVYRYICESRLMVHVAIREGLPRAVVEAMACGRPVVAYRSTLPGGLVHGEHGLLVTPETLEAEVGILLNDPARLEAMGGAARCYALKEHGPGALDRVAGDFLGFAARLGLALPRQS